MRNQSIGERVAKQLMEGLAKKRARAEAAKQPKAKLVSDQRRLVGAAVVHLSPSDPNWRGSSSQYVIIREDLAEAQRADREAYRRLRMKPSLGSLRLLMKATLPRKPIATD
jgi:hypothetical protein